MDLPDPLGLHPPADGVSTVLGHGLGQHTLA